jgi:hypothetical protein
MRHALIFKEEANGNNQDIREKGLAQIHYSKQKLKDMICILQR